MQPTVVFNRNLLDALADILAGEWAAATVSLFTNDVDPGPDAVVGDFDLATFTGSTPVAIGTWGEAFMNANGQAEAVAPLIQFDWDAGAEETVYGVLVKSAGVGTPIVAYARFDDPILMQDTGDSIALVPRLQYGPLGMGSFAMVSE